MFTLQELVRLHRMGTPVRTVARMLGVSPNTERQYRQALERQALLDGSPDALPTTEALNEAVRKELPERTPIQQASKAEPYRGAIEKMLLHGATPTAIYDRLRLEEKEDFEASLSSVKRLCKRLLKDRGIRAEDVVIPVETEPGDVAQVDFGYIGTLYDPREGRERKAWVFVLVLGYSRHMVCRIVYDQKIETWIRCHVEAFEELGGVPRTLVPDNLKSAVVRAAFGLDDETTLNRSYCELARYYGFKVDPTPVRSPEKKGKVESGVKYVKRNFFAARREEKDADVLRGQLDQWAQEVAGLRIHGTTRQQPLAIFEELERQAMLPLPPRPYEIVLWREPKVHPDTHVLVEKALYSVPWRLVGQKLLARVTNGSVLLFHNEERVATHERAAPGQRRTVEEHLPPDRRAYRHRGRHYWIERAAKVGTEAEALVRELFDSEEVLSPLREVQRIVTHIEGFPAERANAACARARYYGNHKYRGLKDILRKALDRHPLPVAVQPQRPLFSPRFARDIRDLLPTENDHAS